MANNTHKSELTGVAVVAVALVLALNLACAQSDEPAWTRLSTTSGDLPAAGVGPQVGTLVLDIDRDGFNDFVVAGFNDMVWYRFDPATRSWTKYDIEVGAEAFGVRIEAGGDFEDIDGDGDLDIVQGATSSGKIWWWENPWPTFDPGTLWARHEVLDIGGQHHDQMFGDFDGDGDPELAFFSNGLILAEIAADPTDPWTYTNIGPAGREGMDQADINLDGQIDIVGGGYWYEHVSGTTFITHDVDPSFDRPRVAVGDLIEGGRPEILYSAGEVTGTLKLYEWNGSAWDPTILIEYSDWAHALEIGDINGDGHLDIITGEMHPPWADDSCKLYILYGDGAGGFQTTVLSTGVGSHESKIGDLDGDGDLDVLHKDFQYETRVDLWLNNDTGSAVRITDAVDEGRDCFRIHTPSATYYFDKAGGGFTSILDREGTDWIGWNASSGSAGQFRGIPNTGELHAGCEGGTSTTNDALDTPLSKVTIETMRNGYGASWEFFPTHAMMTLHTVPAGGSYSMLYAGIPGGAVDSGDRFYLSNGQDYAADEDHPWNGAAAPPDDFEDIENTSGSAVAAEWGFFVASEVNRSFFLAHTDDAVEDDYWQMNDQMTVFGFGRADSNDALLSLAGAELVIGFVDSTDPVTVASGIHAACSAMVPPQQVATPGIVPAGGTYFDAVTVALTCSTPDAEIRYSLDGSAPTESSMLYAPPLSLTADALLKARAFRSGWLPSEMAEASYTIVLDEEPPLITAVSAANDPNLVVVEFDEALEPGSAQTPGNFSVSPGITVSGAALQGDQRTVHLAISSLSGGVTYTLTVSGVSDLAGNPLAPGTARQFSFEPADVTTGLVAHWKLDEREGSSAIDVTGAHDGTLHGPSREAGKLGRALRFDGVDDHVSTGTWDVSGQALTICAWMWADRFDNNPSHDGRILSKADGGVDDDHTWMLSTIKLGSVTRLRFRVKTGGSTTTLIATQGDMTAGEWVHAAAVYDGANMIIYKNGLVVGSTAKSGDLTAEPVLAVWLGDNPSGAGDRPFEGLLDDVRVYARALTPGEVGFLAAWSPLTTIGDWGASYAVPTGDLTLDSDGDRVPLLFEYAFRLDPTVADGIYLQSNQGTHGLPVGALTVMEPRRLAIEYVRRSQASDLIYTVEFCSDLQSDWAASGQPDTVIELGPEWERVIATDGMSIEDADRRFGRLKAAYAP